MKKIDKKIHFATAYQKWIKQQEQAWQEKGKKIPDYNNNPKYYSNDVFIALLFCQNGLCAYTEKQLIKTEDLHNAIQQFDENGKYLGKRPECAADLEHFDSQKKSENGWAWENFFVVYDSINQKVKGEKEIDYILKPDNEHYNPFQLLEYDTELHIFFANESENDGDTCQKVERMIQVLGLNYTPIKNERKEYLEELWLKAKTHTNLFPDRFITAHEMAISQFTKHS